MYGLFSTIRPFTERRTIICFRNKLRLKENRTIYHIMHHHYDDVMNQNNYLTEEQKEQKYKNNVYNKINGRYFITLHAKKSIRKIDDIDFNEILDNTFDQ